MNVLARAIPDVEVLLALEPEELGAKLLFLIKREIRKDMVTTAGVTGRTLVRLIASKLQ